MCKTWPSNSGYTFLIAIKDYNFQNDGEDFLNSGAGISITNGLQTVEREMEATSIVEATELSVSMSQLTAISHLLLLQLEPSSMVVEQMTIPNDWP